MTSACFAVLAVLAVLALLAVLAVVVVLVELEVLAVLVVLLVLVVLAVLELVSLDASARAHPRVSARTQGKPRQKYKQINTNTNHKKYVQIHLLGT